MILSYYFFISNQFKENIFGGNFSSKYQPNIHRMQICKYGCPAIFCLDRFSRKEKQLNNDKDQVKTSHYVHFQGHIPILGEVIGN